MKLKELRLDVEAALSQAVFGDGFLHYGYWPQGNPDVASIESLGKAQREYFEKLIKTIPNDVATILDVGSGTGSNALELINRGYEVDCVCPSPQLNALARSKLPDQSLLHECQFENLTTQKLYDMLLFAESFHYIDARKSLENAANYASKYVIIFDYFRRTDSNHGKRISYDQFLLLLRESFASEFEILHDEDVTQFIIPTFYVIDEISNNSVKPFIKKAASSFKTEHPYYSFILSRLVNRLHRYAKKPSNRHQSFSENNQYRLILLRRRKTVRLT
jgi:SAM-dependent methyltransferase